MRFAFLLAPAPNPLSAAASSRLWRFFPFALRSAAVDGRSKYATSPPLQPKRVASVTKKSEYKILSLAVFFAASIAAAVG